MNEHADTYADVAECTGGTPFYTDEWFLSSDSSELGGAFDPSNDMYGGIAIAGEDDCVRRRVILSSSREWVINWYATNKSYEKALGGVGNDPTDPRWQCELWRGNMPTFAQRGFVESYGSDLGISGEPLILLPPYASNTAHFAWRAGNGGVIFEIVGEMTQACKQCDPCFARRPDRFTVSRVYFIQAISGGPIKIGRSASPMARLPSLQTGNPFPLRIIATMAGGPAVEGAMHTLFARDRLKGEWFTPSRELMAFIREINGNTQTN